MTTPQVYMDHNATTPLHPQVVRAMIEAMDLFGNPSSLHGFGRRAHEAVENARQQVASLIGARPENILFTGSGSEANNTVLQISRCRSGECDCPRPGGQRLVTTTIEHPCVLETSRCLAMNGLPVSFVGVDEHGRLRMDQLEQEVADNAMLVSVMMANNEIGTVLDVARAAGIAHHHGALFHTDAVQAVGKIPVHVDRIGADFLVLSGHKIYGPKGIGALYVREHTPFCPLIRGGHQERNRRAGTENTLGIIGLGKAAEMRAKEMQAEADRLLELKTALRQGIQSHIPNIRFNGHPEHCVPGTLNVSFEGVEGEALLLYLDFEGIAVSTGSACASGSLDPSHVLLATGMPAEIAHGSVRFSLGRDNTLEDVAYVVDKLREVVERTRAMSTVPTGR